MTKPRSPPMTTAAATPVDAPVTPVTKGAAGHIARLSAELNRLQAEAQKRLDGTRAGALIDKLPAMEDAMQSRLDDAVDAALDRLGLVRKAKVAVVANDDAVDAAVTVEPIEAVVAANVEATPSVEAAVESAPKDKAGKADKKPQKT